METVFDGSVKTGEIVMKCPRAGTLLKRYKIDYSCEGNQEIGAAIEENNLDQSEVLDELNSLYERNANEQRKVTKWEKQKLRDLLQYIMDAHHSYLYMALPNLHRMLNELYSKHSKTHPELSNVHYLFSILKIELEQHIIMEEELIFPKILAYEKKPTLNALIDIIEFIEDLEREHVHINHLLKDLREATSDYTVPRVASDSYRMVYVKLDELESDLFQHLHLENNILFPRLLREMKKVL